MSKKIVVIGLGVLGRNMAVLLESRGAEVIAIDSDMGPVEEIKDKVTMAVALDSTNEKALLALDIANVDAAVVCIGENFQANLLTTVLLKKMKVKYVITRAANPIEKQILRELGADELIYPEEDLARELSVRLTSNSLLDLVSLGPNLGAARLKVPVAFIDKKLLDLNLRVEYGINIISIYRQEDIQETVNPFPKPDHVFAEGEIMLVVGANKDIARITELP